MGRSLVEGRIVPVGPNPLPTHCDALQTLEVAPLTFGILKARGAAGLFVTETEISAAMRIAMTKLGLILEPGGAVALAAVLAGKAKAEETTVILLSGRNVDPATFARMTAG
jgi:threonine dehydratase